MWNSEALSAQTFSCDSPESRGRQVRGGGVRARAEALGQTAAWLSQPRGDVPGLPAELSPGTRGREAGCDGGSSAGGEVGVFCTGKEGRKWAFFMGARQAERLLERGGLLRCPRGRRINLTFTRSPALAERNSDFSVSVEGR